MATAGRAALAGCALIAVCAAATPSPRPSPTRSPIPSPAPSAVRSAIPSPAPPAARSTAPAATLETPYYKLETDDVSLKGNGDYVMPHKVTFSRPGSDGTADRAEGNRPRGTVSLLGNVVVHDNGKAPEAGSTDEYAKGGPSTLTCDRLDVDSKAKTYVALGHVHYVQGERKADAERGVLNRTTGMLHLEGNVKTSEGGSSMTARFIDYNINTKRIEAEGNPIVIKQPVPTPEPGSITPSPKPKKRRLPF